MKNKHKKIKYVLIGGITVLVLTVGIIILFSILSDNESGGMIIHYYKNGKEVFPKNIIYSVVAPYGEDYDQLSFEILGTNTGTLQITNLSITETYPSFLKNYFPKTGQSLNVGETKSLWKSSLVELKQFENLTQPINFSVRVLGKDYIGRASNSTFSVVLKIVEGYSQINLSGNDVLADLSIDSFGGVSTRSNSLSIRNSEDGTDVLYITFTSLNRIPENAYIQKANLILTYSARQNWLGCNKVLPVDIYPVYNPIIESFPAVLNWNNQPCGVNFDNINNCDINKKVQLDLDVGSKPTGYFAGIIKDSFDVTNAVKQAYLSRQNTTTLLIKFKDSVPFEDSCQYIWYARDDIPIDNYPPMEYQPQLVIDYA